MWTILQRSCWSCHLQNIYCALELAQEVWEWIKCGHHSCNFVFSKRNHPCLQSVRLTNILMGITSSKNVHQMVDLNLTEWWIMLIVMIIYLASLNHFRITNILTDTGTLSWLFSTFATPTCSSFLIHKISFYSIYFLRSKSLGHIHLYVLEEKEGK